MNVGKHFKTLALYKGRLLAYGKFHLSLALVFSLFVRGLR